MRIAFFELGKIHYNFGFLNEAIKTWIRSHDFSTSEEDLFNVSFTIAQAAFENMATPYLSKFAGEADARDKGKNVSRTVQVKILDALSSISLENYRDAAIKLTSMPLSDVQAISELVRPQDLAFYVVICSLKSLNRSDIKQTILQASGFKTLMELSSSSGNLEDVIENFLNGRYMEFQR